MLRFTLLSLTVLLSLSSCSYDCNSSNCADGCCGEHGVCYVGGPDKACGLLGAACVDCSASGTSCAKGACVVSCQAGRSCRSKADCCATHFCVNGECESCRIQGEVCSIPGAACCEKLDCERPFSTSTTWTCRSE
ncbi:MAG: hypothetical protein HY901_05355 [Deltaproteobacteria bacterium]|nr:hypothetical protein [Deltaproteobacteria bacterium]